MKIKCLKCETVVEVTGKELEQKAAIFNSYMNSAADYLNLLSLTGGECKVKNEKLGNKHFFEFEEGTESAISDVLSSAGIVQAGLTENIGQRDGLRNKIIELNKELETANSLLKTVETAIPVSISELEKQKAKFKEITGIEDIEKWK